MTTRQAYHSTGLSIHGDAIITPGLATNHGLTIRGHVTVYTDDGHLSISADSVAVLRRLSTAFGRAGDELERKLAGRQVARTVTS